jgi:hypothetical protein
MVFVATSNSILASRRAKQTTQSLVSTGKGFDLEGPYEFAPILKWMKDSHQALAPFPEEQDEFDLFCLNSYAFPKDRVEWGVQILEQALHKLASDEGTKGVCPHKMNRSVGGQAREGLLQEAGMPRERREAESFAEDEACRADSYVG